MKIVLRKLFPGVDGEDERARFGQLVRGFRPDLPETDIDQRIINSTAQLQMLYSEIQLYRWPIRSIIKASPGCVLLDVDYLGAELLGAGVMSGDAKLIDHAQRAALPEDHPNFYDIHSSITVLAFRLN